MGDEASEQSEAQARPTAKPDCEFARMTHQILVRERRRSMRDVAEALGLSYGALQARVIGRVPFSPDEVNLILREIPDLRLVDMLLRHTRFSAIERPQPRGGATGETPLDTALHALEEVVEAVKHLANLHGDHAHAEMSIEHLDGHLNEAQRSIAMLRLVLPQLQGVRLRLERSDFAKASQLVDDRLEVPK